MIPKRRPLGFFEELDLMAEKLYRAKFFDDCDAMTADLERERLRLERYRARRKANGDRAYRILLRLRKVLAIDLHRMTQHIEPDWFGEKHLQFAEIKRLYDKKARIAWFLTGLYNYLAFDYEGQGWSSKRGFKYSRHRAHYYKLLDTHRENLRQQKWDKKRERIRSRREEKLRDKTMPTAYELRIGLGNHPVFKGPGPSADEEAM